MLSRAEIEQLSAWLAATDIAVLELRGPDGGVRLERRGAIIDVSDIGEPAAKVTAAPGGATIVADTPGIFLHRHPLRAAALVEPGTKVARGHTVGLLQVGPLLLPVRAPCAGRVEGFWAADGAAVGYGTPLIELHVQVA